MYFQAVFDEQKKKIGLQISFSKFSKFQLKFTICELKFLKQAKNKF